MSINEANNKALNKLANVMKEYSIEIQSENYNGISTVTLWVGGNEYSMNSSFIDDADVERKCII